MIDVQQVSDNEFKVTVEEDGSSTQHTVMLDDVYHQKIAQKIAGKQLSKQELIEKSFEFLLSREPKESILGRFHLKEISRYFPDYESRMSG
jgi:hypothetical protein